MMGEFALESNPDQIFWESKLPGLILIDDI